MVRQISPFRFQTLEPLLDVIDLSLKTLIANIGMTGEPQRRDHAIMDIIKLLFHSLEPFVDVLELFGMVRECCLDLPQYAND